MSSAPEEIQEEILLWLPVKSLSRFKSVCKRWNELIRSSKFVDDHLSLTHRKPSKIMIMGRGGMFYSMGYASISTESASCMSDGIFLATEAECRCLRILGSCNGLICLGSCWVNSRRVILWNPSTNEYKDITLPVDDRWVTSYGFGYDRTSSITDHKLVCITRYEVHVYTLESNSWSRFNIIPSVYITESTGLFLNGALHWCEARTAGAIISLDISSSKFMNWPIPEEITPCPIPNDSDIVLRVLGDSLCLVCGIYDVQVDVWVMQNYGDRESWIKKFTTNQEEITSRPSCLKMYWSFENGVILIQIHGGFALYDQKNDRIRLLNFSGINGSYPESVGYVESLVSLNSGSCTSKNRW